jgi:hypothetical protein
MKRLILSIAALALVGTAFSGQVEAAARRGNRPAVHRHVNVHHGRTIHGNHRRWGRVQWSPRYRCKVFYSVQTNCWYRYNATCGCYVRIATGPVCP